MGPLVGTLSGGQVTRVPFASLDARGTRLPHPREATRTPTPHPLLSRPYATHDDGNKPSRERGATPPQGRRKTCPDYTTLLARSSCIVGAGLAPALGVGGLDALLVLNLPVI